MSGFFETLLGSGGAIIGGVGGGVGGAVVGAATEGMIGAAVGGAGGAVFAGVGAVPGAAAGATIGGGYGATVGGVTGAVAGGVGGWTLGSEAGANIDQQLSDWWNADDAAEKADAKATAITCATCAQNPCAHLACGAIVPGNKYRGGAHGCMTGTDETKGDGLESHHMPAKSKSPLHPNVGPAIQMEPRPDHKWTASHSGKANGPSYAAQRKLLDKGNVYAAFLLDAADAKRVAIAVGDPTRYDLAIAQAKLYADCLKKTGIIR